MISIIRILRTILLSDDYNSLVCLVCLIFFGNHQSINNTTIRTIYAKAHNQITAKCGIMAGVIQHGLVNS